MSEHSEAHGWKPIAAGATFVGQPASAASVEFCAFIDERHRCVCRDEPPFCANRATQEDLRCDYCREHCP